MGKFKHKLTLPAIIFSLLLVIFLLYFGLTNFHRQTSLPPDSNQAAIGVELNQDLDNIDLHRLQAVGISFVYFRSTQGRSYFDDNYLIYRDQVQGTQLAYGSAIFVSNQSTASQQYRYFRRKVGLKTGSLPILLQPAVNSRSLRFIRIMARLTRLLRDQHKRVMVEISNQYRQYFPLGTLFMADGGQQPNKMQYAFWCYNSNGRVKNVPGLEKNVRMFAYNGTVAQYKNKYGQLTQ